MAVRAFNPVGPENDQYWVASQQLTQCMIWVEKSWDSPSTPSSRFRIVYGTESLFTA
jgi:hypothetical protein